MSPLAPAEPFETSSHCPIEIHTAAASLHTPAGSAH
jgi:hypothetical protein